VENGALVFVISARDGPKDFEIIKQKAACMDALIETANFERDRALVFFRHCLSKFMDMDVSGLELPREVRSGRIT
jgi:hypothetical protein